MLQQFRRHGRLCKKEYAHDFREGIKCNCAVHIEGIIESSGTFIRSTACHTRNWKTAEQLVEQAERTGVWSTKLLSVPLPVSMSVSQSGIDTRIPFIAPKSEANIDQAVAKFLGELAAITGKNLKPPTVGKHRTTLQRLQSFASKRGFVYLDDINLDALTVFKSTWPLKSIDAIRNTITRLREFYKFSLDRKWVSENVAEKLTMPKEVAQEVMPLTEEQELAIYRTAKTIKLDKQQVVTNEEILTFLYLMRWSAMAISDAALFEVSELKKDEVRYLRNKLITSVKRKIVVVPLPGWVEARLKALPLQKHKYFFCHYSNDLRAVCDIWHKLLRRVFDEAGCPDATPHSFRHTFATYFLAKGESITTVSRWLGHGSVKTTEDTYSHWLEEYFKHSSAKMRKYHEDLHEPVL